MPQVFVAFFTWRLVSQILFLGNNLSMPSFFQTWESVLIASVSEVAAGRIARFTLTVSLENRKTRLCCSNWRFVKNLCAPSCNGHPAFCCLDFPLQICSNCPSSKQIYYSKSSQYYRIIYG